LDAGCGADVDLEKVPLKEAGLAPWEIWVSESQERMMVTCKEENVEKILQIFEMWDVPATVVARTTDQPRTRIFWEGQPIFDMDLEFLTGGPVYNRPYVLPRVSTKANEKFPELPANNEVILKLLSDLNVASKEWAIRQYDHEVRAGTVLRPMVGKMNMTGPGDATVLMPVQGRWKGLAAAVGCNPWFCEEDPYKGGMGCIDEACRNIIAVGARPHAFTDCLNFGNPEKPERLGEFREAVRGLGEICKKLKMPIPSGNVSLYNEAPGGIHILPTPMILGTGLIDDVRKAVSADFKEEGNLVFVVGKTLDEMAGSLLFRKFGGVEGDVPAVDVDNLIALMDKMLAAMDKSLVRACHDCSDGGLAVAVSEMCISGDIGADIDLKEMGSLETERKLYSESNTRWIAEVRPENEAAFREILGDDAKLIGRIGGDRLTIKEAGVDLAVTELRKAWNDPVWKIMGGAAE